MPPGGRPVRLLLAALVGLLLNSAYLWAFAEPTVAHYAQIVLHPILGVLLMWGTWTLVRRSTRDWLVISAVAVLSVGAVLGAVVLVLGATRPYVGWLSWHAAISAPGVCLLVVWCWRASGSVLTARHVWSLRLTVVAVLLIATVVAVVGQSRQAGRGARYRIENPTIVPASMEGEGRGPASPFFPSSADTNVRGLIPANFFLTSESCGRCHKELYDEWQSSMHHFSSFNNQWYRKSIEYMQDVVGTKPSKWCAGCHDHAVLFNGRFDRPIKEQINTPEAQAGLSCTSCHSITRVGSTMGQGDFEVEYPPLHDLATSDNPLLQAVHDKLIELDPQPHRETFLKPFHREQTAEFCSSCHKVHLDVPVNGYRWFRGFNDYDNWQASGVSGQGARSFYYPPQPQKCADCHMPLVASADPAAKNGQIRSHRFAAANTAIPFVNGDQKQLKAVQDFLKDGQVSIDVFGIVRGAAPVGRTVRNTEEAGLRAASTFAVGEESGAFGAQQAFLATPGEVVGPIGVEPVTVQPGESVRLEVVVRTRKVGHFFPGGTVDAFDVWVDLEVVDDLGQKIFHSGALQDGNGPVDPGAHIYRSLLLDEHGNPINKRNAWAARSVAYVRLIAPGSADTIHYRLDVPENVGSRLQVKATVKYRKFAWWNTQWAYAGVRDPQQAAFSIGHGHDDGRWVFTGDTSQVSGALKAIPDLPVTDVAVGHATIDVRAKGAPAPTAAPVNAANTRERWNDYGIGLLLQGDLKGAEAAFLKVTQLEPTYADGWVNVGRARVQEGNLDGAEQVLRKALEIDPELAKTHFFLGTALKSLGRYDEAIDHLRQAAARYPRDRVVRNQLGRVLFLQRRYADAVAEFKQVLEVDAEDLQAHYNLMLAYQGLGDTAQAEKERVLYERFKVDESAQTITGEYRLLNPEDNNERQPVHEHQTGRLSHVARAVRPPATTIAPASRSTALSR